MNTDRLIPHSRRSCRPLIAAALFSLALFGYPIVANVISLLNIESRLLSLPFRLLVGLFSVYILLTMGRARIDNWRMLVLIIWYVLLLRLGYDTFIAETDGADYALQFFIVGCLLPTLALWKLDAYDQERFASAGFIVASIGSLSSLFARYLGAFGEADLASITGRLSSIALNPVSLGDLAVSGLFCGIVIWRKASPWARMWLAIVMAAQCVVLAQTGSKGPMLALAIAVLLWSIRRGMAGRLMMFTAPLLLALALLGSNPLLERFAGMYEDPSTMDRIMLIRDSVEQIADSPWFGSSSVELKSGYYPHNILLEAALCFGIPLMALLASVLVRGLVVSWALLKSDDDLLGLLFIQALIVGQISGSLFTSSLVWIPLVLLLGRGLRLQKENTQLGRSSRAGDRYGGLPCFSKGGCAQHVPR